MAAGPMASVIVAGARTPFGKFGGAFKEVPAKSLGAHAIRAALDLSGVQGEDVDYVIMGHVLQAGAGQITARQAAIEAGIPQQVPAITINKVCLSGINAIALADQLIRAGEVEVVVAGGMESMSEAPYLFPKARFGARMGNSEVVDSMIHDGLWSTFTEQHMGESSDEVNLELELSREDQDEWAARSHQRAEKAWNEGTLRDEIVMVALPQKRGEPVRVERLQPIQLLSNPHKEHRPASHLHDGEHRPAAGVAVQLGHDEAVDPQQLIKALRDVDPFLPGHGVQDEQHLVR